MFFNSPLTTAVLLQRYKRFLVDVKLADGSTVTAHCPNTGSMLSCSAPGSLAAISSSDNPNRKYPYTLEMVRDKTTWVGVNTSRTNALVAEAIEEGRIREFQEVTSIKREVKVSAESRLDLLVSHSGRTTYMEVKNCSLAENGCAMFPDAVTARGTKHLHELIQLAAAGRETCIFFLVQRMDADRFAPAAHIDPLYSRTLQLAAEKGVNILVYQARISLEGIEIKRKLPCELSF